MKRCEVLVVFLLAGCAHQATIKGLENNPSARIDTATFSRSGDDVIVDVQLGVSADSGDENPQVRLQTQIPCREGSTPPPSGFRMVYVTFNPTVLSTLTVKEGYITVHKCEGATLEFSGGWFVEGIVPTPLELPHARPSAPVPIKHVELTRVTATQVQPNATLH